MSGKQTRRARFQDVIDRVGPLDPHPMTAARKRQDLLTMPPGSLGRLERLATQVAGITAFRARDWPAGLL